METSPAEKMEEGMQKQDWGTFKYVSTDESGSDDDELRGYISTVDFISFEKPKLSFKSIGRDFIKNLNLKNSERKNNEFNSTIHIS